MKKPKFNMPAMSRGFTLVEMAMVLLIVSLLTSGLLVAISNSNSTIRETRTKTQLEEIEEALYGYAQFYGHLPCPASATSNGLEADLLNDGECTSFHGFVPSVTLGLTGNINVDSLVLDAWGNPITYSVSDLDIGGDKAFTSTAGMVKLFDDVSELDGNINDLIIICDVNGTTSCIGNTLATNIPAVIISMGPNWATFSSANEAENADDTVTYAAAATPGPYVVPGDYLFVDTGYSEENFDDQIVWLSPHILFSRLIKADQLP